MEFLRQLADAQTYADVAKQFGVPESSISQIMSRLKGRNVTAHHLDSFARYHKIELSSLLRSLSAIAWDLELRRGAGGQSSTGRVPGVDFVKLPGASGSSWATRDLAEKVLAGRDRPEAPSHRRRGRPRKQK